MSDIQGQTELNDWTKGFAHADLYCFSPSCIVKVMNSMLAGNVLQG